MAETGANGKWRLIFNPQGEVSDMLAYPSALVEGRIAGKYLLSGDTLPDTVVVQGFKEKGILAGADVAADREAAERIDAIAPEHLSIQVRDPWRVLLLVRNAGAIASGLAVTRSIEWQRAQCVRAIVSPRWAEGSRPGWATAEDINNAKSEICRNRRIVGLPI